MREQIRRYDGAFAESDYRGLLDVLNETALVSITDAAGTIIYANDKFAAVSQYAREELIGENHRILKSGEQPQELFVDLWETISNGRLWHGELKNRAKDGSYYWVDTTIAPIAGADGKPVRYISIRFIITDRKEAQERAAHYLKDIEDSKKAMLNVLEDLETERTHLAEAKAKDDAILGSIVDGVLILDMQGRPVYGNESARAIIGADMTDADLAQEGVARFRFFDAQDRRELSPAERPLARLREGGKVENETFFVTSPEHPEGRFVAFSARIVESGGVPFGFLIVFRDITKEHEADRAKTEFVSIASHQLRTPTTVIRWYAEMLLGEKEVGPLTPAQRMYLEEIYRNDKRMIELVSSLLNVSRIELGALAVQSRKIDLRRLLEDVVAESRPLMREKRIAVRAGYAGASEISTDPDLLRSALQNLIVNAVEYTSPGGSISCTAAATPERVAIEVSDTGCGIPASAHGKVFGKFFRADNARSVKPDGSGLGLYITKSIVQALGGSVSFVSREGAGTTFTVTLPMRYAEAEGPSRVVHDGEHHFRHDAQDQEQDREEHLVPMAAQDRIAERIDEEYERSRQDDE